MQWLGLYVASFLLVAGFMRFIGRIAWWKSLLTSFVFAFAMFATFDVAFDVIMPKGRSKRCSAARSERDGSARPSCSTASRS